MKKATLSGALSDRLWLFNNFVSAYSKRDESIFRRFLSATEARRLASPKRSVPGSTLFRGRE
jgi:hypothetical protein